MTLPVFERLPASPVPPGIDRGRYDANGWSRFCATS